MNESNTLIGENMSEPSHEQKAALAYFIWMSEGCPEGRQEANWHDAERQLAESSSNSPRMDQEN